MQVLDRLFGCSKPVIAMVHLPPLPGRPDYEAATGMSRILDAVGRDLEILQDSGVDAVLFCNEADLPYQLRVGPEVPAAMAHTIGRLRESIRVPFGVNVLWDPTATLAVAAATGATFVREVFTGVYESEMGLIEPRIGDLAAYRVAIGCKQVALFDNVSPEFASSIGHRGVADRARAAVYMGMEAVLISGAAAGVPLNMSDLRSAKEAVPNAPVLANTGVRIETVAEILEYADGVIVGTALKRDGHTWNEVDRDRSLHFMDRVRDTREKGSARG